MKTLYKYPFSIFETHHYETKEQPLKNQEQNEIILNIKWRLSHKGGAIPSVYKAQYLDCTFLVLHTLKKSKLFSYH